MFEVEIHRESVCQSVSEMNESVSQISVVLIASVAASIAATVAATIAAAESGQLRAAWNDEWWSEINWSFAHFVL